MNKAPVAPRWEMKFGKVQVFIFSILFTVCMAFCFYLGFSAGRTTGHDQALARALASSPKLPVQGGIDDEIIDSQSKDIYAALQEVPDVKPVLENKNPAHASEKDAPELASLPSISASDVESTTTSSLSEALGEPSLEGAKAAGNSKTLADLANNQPLEGAKVKENIPQEKAVDDKSSIVSKEAIKPLAEVVTPPKKDVVLKEEKPKVESQKVGIAGLPSGAPSSKETLKKEENKKDEAKLVDSKKDTTKTKPSTSNGGWFAQVAAPENLVDATAITKKLRASGFSASIENANVRGQSYYRILVGPEENKEQGERLLQQLKRESYLSGAPFLRFIK